ncbi:alpha/beta hydrolase [Streptomyces mirabilis]|nr:alpha/beta hydrolase [Streptomyces mirabilis]
MITADARTATFGEVRYAYRILWNDHPRTEPILVPSGALRDMYAWPRIERHLHAITTVVLVDLPGTGYADDSPPGAPADYPQLVLHHLLEEVPLPSVNLVGLCSTSAMTYEFAQQHPRRVRRLALGGVLSAAPGSPHPLGKESIRRLERAWTMLAEGNVADFARQIVLLTVDSTPDSPVRDRDIVAALLTRLLGELTPEEAARTARNARLYGAFPSHFSGLYDIPTLVFTGEHDPLTTPELCYEVAASIKGAVFTTVRESDHMVHVERPEEYADLLIRFFTDQPLDNLPHLTPPTTPASK